MVLEPGGEIPWGGEGGVEVWCGGQRCVGVWVWECGVGAWVTEVCGCGGLVWREYMYVLHTPKSDSEVLMRVGWGGIRGKRERMLWTRGELCWVTLEATPCRRNKTASTDWRRDVR